MKLLSYGKDGGQDSTVWGFWLFEIKPLASIALLCFEDGSREAFHSHAFNSISWLLSGALLEDVVDDKNGERIYGVNYMPSMTPIYTSRKRMHKVFSLGRSWVLTFRGPWASTWKEYLPKLKKFVTLTSGRKIIEQTTE